VLKNAFGVSLIFRKHRSIDVDENVKKGVCQKKEKRGKEERGANLQLSNFIATRPKGSAESV
jgi:hypothetical protein